MLHQIQLKAIFGWSLFWLFMPDAPSNSAKVLFGWSLHGVSCRMLHRIQLKAIFGWSLFGFSCRMLHQIQPKSYLDGACFGISCLVLHQIQLKSYLDGTCFGFSCLVLHQIQLKSYLDGACYTRQAFFIPSNFVEAKNGCTESARKLLLRQPLRISPNNPHHRPVISLSEQVQMIQQVIQVVVFPPVRISRQQRAHLFI